MAKGEELSVAVEHARRFVAGALRAAAAVGRRARFLVYA